MINCTNSIDNISDTNNEKSLNTLNNNYQRIDNDNSFKIDNNNNNNNDHYQLINNNFQIENNKIIWDLFCK